MHDATYAHCSRLAQQLPRVVFRIARVNNKRESGLAPEPDLRAKNRLLHVPRRVVVVVVESTFANCDRAVTGVLANQPGVAAGIEPLSVVGVNTGGIPDEPGIGLRDLPRCASGAEDVPGAASGADADNRFGSVFPGATNYIAAVAVERLVCEVRVAVDERCDTEVFFGHFL